MTIEIPENIEHISVQLHSPNDLISPERVLATGWANVQLYDLRNNFIGCVQVAVTKAFDKPKEVL